MPSLTPLHFIRSVNDDVQLNEILFAKPKQTDREFFHIKYGNSQYVTDCHRFLIERYGQQWNVRGYVGISNPNIGMAKAIAASGLTEELFATRREALMALEAFCEENSI